MRNVLVIGAGGVGSATAHKCAQHNDELGDICIASRTVAKCERIVESVRARDNLRTSEGKLSAAGLDAKDTQAVAELIERSNTSIVLNAGSPHCNLAVIEACLRTGAHYLDTAIYEKEGDFNMPVPWYANYEWKYRDRFAASGVTGILGIGFDPGAVNAFCAYVKKHLIDDIDSIDIMDVNAGDHGQFFATNFDPEVNLREILEDVVYWENGEWARVPCHSKSRTYDFPVVGAQKVYSMGHDELHSLAVNIPAKRIEFWMGFSDSYINVFNVLNRLGLLSGEPVDVEGVPVVPLKLLKAVLPDPASLAPGYTGKVCIGCLVKGRSAGKNRELFIYSSCDHAECYADVGAQAISYTTAVPLVSAALLIARNEWNVGKLVNVEELDPDPFMAIMPELGIDWKVREA
ncbi:MAG: saccharopine dehydrogenase [Gammaproteobacteria bacterium]|nr:saccharopine dehydrogenase [Gammaproteobacteria bacterium]NIM73080.1 saccharopine dehydrogenase [Gammaproteobacteria bacterium]NIN38697.1 saccharopine dehydrogenase [Gammaproteobacteria bacterium]NIO24833.1 saccharopine dehydrogenase [Gammaproteobacteria bacterium]NIO65436.1 saccharopine dehydrogenase [Gammaproteobacteria bacterium]